MQFLRFGSSIPGSMWGCCCGDVIQDFAKDPDAKASIQLVEGDGGYPITDHRGVLFAGKTYREIFWSRLRYGTFSNRDMPNHFFLAVLTQSQCNGTIGKKWLAILKEAGFEFIRAVDNSVYSGRSITNAPHADGGDSHVNYVFGLFRNIGSGSLKDPYTPPAQWTEITGGKVTLADVVNSDTESLTKAQFDFDKAVWDKIGPPKFYTEAELEAESVPVIYAGRRSEFPQETKAAREAKEQMKNKSQAKANAFPTA